MKLQLTSTDNFYKDVSNLLLLGEWCVDINDKKNYNIAKNHYSNLEEVTKNSEFCYKVYDFFISKVSDKLNKLNNKNYSNRYWEILIGPWLWFYICVVYDRYKSLLTVSKKYKDLEVTIADKNYVCSKFVDNYYLIQKHEYNYFIFSEIIKNYNFDFQINFHQSDNLVKYLNSFLLPKLSKKTKQRINYIYLLKKFIKIPFMVINFIKLKYAKSHNNFININMPVGLDKKLYRKLNQVFYQEYRSIIIPNLYVKIDTKIRAEKIVSYKLDQPFYELINNLLLNNIPIEYLENYKLNSECIKHFIHKKIPRLIGVRSPCEFHSVLRFLTSEYSRLGAKILSCQEGGGQGARIINLMDEKIDSRFADLYLTWGWKSKEKNTIPFYFTKLFWLKKYKYNVNGSIIILGASCRNYFHSFNSGQLPIYNSTLIKMNVGLIKSVNKAVYKDLIYRFHWQFGYNEIEYIKKEFSNLKISTREKESHFYELFFKSKLIVITTDFTTIKQAFVCNHPTILLWDKNYFTVRDSAKKYYDELNKVGILFYNYTDCANKINQISNDPMKWWQTKEVQDAKNKYAEYFCKLSKDISTDLAQTIKKNFLI